MTSIRSKDIPKTLDENRELELLRSENERLRLENSRAFEYIRTKVDDLLTVVGTQALKPEELDNHHLIEFDPIGIVAETFHHVLENVRETNQKLHFAHDEIQAIFDTVGASILVLDVDGRVVSYNQKTRDMMLPSDIDITGKMCREHICQGRTPDERCMFSAVVKEEREQHFYDWPLNGYSFDVVGRPMFDEAGQISHVVLSYKDVTARRNAESALVKALNETQAANATLHGVLRSAADGILITDADGHIVLMNKRAEELFGLCLTDQRGFYNLDVLSHKELVVFLKNAPTNTQGLVVKDFIFSGSQEQQSVQQARLTVIDSPKAGFNGCITILHDVTEERAIERMKSEFISTAAHELRTPLATIIGYADLLLMNENCSEGDKKDYLELIQSKADRLGDIVSDLLDISRIEAGEGVVIDPKPCNLELLCKEVLKSFRHQTEKHTFELESPDPAIIHADRFAVLQILENLVSNAVKYSPQGGPVKVVTSKHDCHCQCSVSDQGLGMNSSQIKKIYDKFYRADATNTAISGTGLGMTIVKHLVEAHNGRIEIASAPGQGTTVTVSFPCAES